MTLGLVDDKAVVTDGKNVKSLRVSRRFRSDFISKYGFVPCSILINDRHSTKDVLDVARDTGRRYSDQRLRCKDENDFQLKKGFDEAFYFSRRGALHGALSTFPQNIGRLMVEFFCPLDGIVYDPFAGHNSRMQLVYGCQRHYIGVDISKEFMKYNFLVRNELLKPKGFFKNEATITLIEGSSAKVDRVESSYADFTLTSPPYWDIEYYGDEPEQLGNAKTYEDFLNLIFPHVQENFRILKLGAYCCWFINDFFKEKIFYPYHCDLYYLFVDAGFTPDNIYIVDLGQPLQAAYVQQIEKAKRFPKRHEYCLVFRKL